MDRYIPSSILHRILELRLLIARAGERDSLAWWDSHALTQQGQWALARLYPGSAAHAGVRLAIEAAVIVHAKTVGHRPAVTLFSLGADLDARVMRQLDLWRMDDRPLSLPPPMRSPSELKAQLSQIIELPDDDLAFLKSATANGSLIGMGPVPAADLWSERKLETIIRRLAAAYASSEVGHLVVPYYRLES